VGSDRHLAFTLVIVGAVVLAQFVLAIPYVLLIAGAISVRSSAWGFFSERLVYGPPPW
jgi:hypothetical protein